MISIAQAFRVWKNMIRMPGYPFPSEAKRIVIALVILTMFGPLLALFGLTAFTIATDEKVTAPTGFFNFVGLLAPLLWAVAIFYVAAVIQHWQDVGRDRWLNEGRMCRTCGAENPRARAVDHYEVTKRFREIRKEYDRLERARRRGQRGHVTETA